MAFAHLHVHTQFSILDGAIPVKKLAPAAAALGQAAVAVTDHCNLYGAVQFDKSCKEAGIHPVFGSGLWWQPEGLGFKDPREALGAWHLIALIEDAAGYRNLCHLITRAIFDGMFYKPRIDLELLRKHREGLILLTSGLRGPVRGPLAAGDPDLARTHLTRLAEIFGPEHLYVELQDVGFEQDAAANDGARRLAAELGLSCVVTNAVHYLKPEQAPVLEVLQCIGSGVSLNDPERRRPVSDQLYLKTEEEMRALFPDDGDAIERTAEIADRCQYKFNYSTYYFPASDPPDGGEDADTDANWEFFYRAFPPPRDFGMPDPEERIPPRPGGAGSLNGYFRWYCEEGLKLRLKRVEDADGDGHKVYWDRLETEIAIVKSMGFPAYFLIVAEFINWAKDRDIPVGPGRGSAAGSLAAWATRITDIDPIRFDLLFERFLNPERVSMPDVDVDFCQDRREEVIQHTREKYGYDYVAQIITYGKLQAKLAVRDVARICDLTFNDADRVAKLIPDELGITLEKAVQEEALSNLMDADVRVRRILTLARGIEGLTRQTGVHAAGVVVADRPLVELVPLYRDGPEGGPVVQFDMKSAESVGLIKFDFLGLKTLDQIRDAVQMIARNTGEQIDMSAVPIDDPPTYELLQKGDALGVFQVESSGMRELLTKLKPSCLDDVVALVALYRPGPLSAGMVDDFIDRKHGRQQVSYPLPQLEPILKSTYGVVVYQEQVMQIAQVLASYSLGEADLLRRAMGKKKPEEMAKQEVRFLEGAEQNNIDKGVAKEIFDLLAMFAAYGFNKCVVADTEIFDADSGERLTVGELLQRRRELRVHALGEDGRLRPRAVTDVVWNGVKPVYELTTELGKRIVATGNHPFRTLGGWTNLEDLSPGDRIAAPRALSVPAAGRWPEHELVTLGWLLSEGNTCHPTALYFYNNDAAAIEDFTRAVERFPQTRTSLYTRPGGRRMEVCVGLERSQLVSEGNLALDVEAVRSGAYSWAEALGLLYKRAHEKAVPAGVFTLCDDDVALFLGRLWTGDGYLSGSQRGIPPYYATSSRRLAVDVQTLLLRLGIVSRLSEKTFKYRGGERTGFTVQLLGDGSRERFIEWIVPHVVGREAQVTGLVEYHRSVSPASSKDTVPAEVRTWVAEEREHMGLTWVELQRRSGVSMKEFTGRGSENKRGFRRATIARLAAFFGSARLRAISESEVFWDRVVSVEPRGLQDTYDLTVDVDHNFLADGLVVHNSHSAAYGYVSYQTAYLKANHRAEYMAALMSIEANNTDKVLTYLNDCRRSGIEILPPDVTASLKGFDVPADNRGVIRFGLGAVKNVGSGAVEAILEAREETGGAFTDMMDFLEHLDFKRVNTRVLENLVKCGAFDWTGLTRSSLAEGLDGAIKSAQSIQQDKAAGQGSLFALFGGGGDKPKPPTYRFPDLAEWPVAQRLGAEKEALGFFISGHPVQAFAAEVEKFATCRIHELGRVGKAGSQVRVAGMPSAMRQVRTKRGDKMGFVTLEDETGSLECVFFSDPWASSQRALKSDQPVVVVGTMEKNQDSVKILAESVELLAELRLNRTREVQIRLRREELEGKKIRALQELLSKNSGRCPARIRVEIPGRAEVILALPPGAGVRADAELSDGVAALLRRTDAVSFL
jgi:DNA polymerase-3 subunit alpha